MEAILKSIFLFLIGTTIINLFIALGARYKTNNKQFTLLILYWLSLFTTYFAAATFSQNPTEIAFSYFLQMIPSFLMVRMLNKSRGIEDRLEVFIPIWIALASVSTFLLLKTDAGFTLSLLPVTLGNTIIYFRPTWNTLVTHRKESNWIEKGMGILFITGVINHFNYPFFRLVPGTEWWGWSISIVQYQCLSIFLPLLINLQRSENEKKNIELALKQISGESSEVGLEVDQLYQNLEIQYSQKEELTRKLKKANGHLEEEREMNEILIKTVSHDLANPLTVVNAYADMILNERIPAHENDMIQERVRANTKFALDMISRIRDAIVTRNQSNFLTIHDVSIDRSIKRLLDSFDSRIKDKKLTVEYTNSVPLDVFVTAEESSLTEHVFSNIISNAIKFSYEGSSIKITVSDDEENVKIVFQDFGIGIEKTRLGKRLLHSTEGTLGESGSGFGMMVMGYFIRKFGGSCQISSEGKDKGTLVSVILKKNFVSRRNHSHPHESARILS